MFVQNLIQRFLLLRCRWLRFLNMQPFHDHIVRQIVLITRIDRYRLGGIGWLYGFRLLQIRIKRWVYQLIEIILRSCFIRECRHRSIAACIIVVNRLIPNSKDILRVGKCVAGGCNRKSRLRRFFPSSKLLCIGHHPLDKWVIIQLFSINHLTVHDTALCQGLPNGNRVYIIQGILLGLGIEAVLLDQLSNAPLYLRPRQFRFLRASGSDNKQALAVAAAILMTQPCGGILLPCMIFHITDNCVFALNITIPRTNGIVNIILGERTQKLM